MTKKIRAALSSAYQEWIKVAREALREARGDRLDGVTHNMLERLAEDLEAGRDPLERLRELHTRITREFDAPARYGSSYHIPGHHRQDMTELEEKIASLEAQEEDDERRKAEETG